MNNPTHNARAYFDQIIEMIGRNDLDGALQRCEAALALHANHVSITALMGTIYLKRKEWKDAETCLQRAVELAPTFAKPQEELGFLLMKSGREREAIPLLENATRLEPDSLRAFSHLGKAHLIAGRPADAVISFARAVSLDPDNARSHCLLAAALARVGRTAAAAEAYRSALTLQPQHPGAWLGLGHALKTLGERQQAVAAYRKCIRLKPESGEPWWSMANLKTFTLNGADIRLMRRSLDRGDNISGKSRVNFLFALGRACEDSRDFRQAWSYYRQGNKLARRQEHYDPVQTEVTNNALIKLFSQGFLAQHAGQGDPSLAPIFIVGLPRSGSTLIEQVLASHSQVEGTAELPYLGRLAASLMRERANGLDKSMAGRAYSPPYFRELGKKYLGQAAGHRHSGRRHFIDKNPNNFGSIGLLKLIFPNARVIDARRQPLDSTLSCYRQLFASGQPFVYDLLELGEYYLQYERMMAHWHAVLPGQIYTVRYEDMVMDSDREIRRLLAYCGLPWEDACARFYETDRPVRTASSEQVRQPIYSTSINYWRNYEPYLGKLIEVLSPALKKHQRHETLNLRQRDNWMRAEAAAAQSR